MKLVLFILVYTCIITTVLQARVANTVSSGNWNSVSTWSGNILPSATDTVIISASHIISIADASPVCLDISFAATNAQLAFTTPAAVLTVYGNFTIVSSAHRAIAQWTNGAAIQFAGSKDVQLLSGWGYNDNGTVLPAIIVNKTAGRVKTSGNNMRLCIGYSLEIVQGVFELAATDDIETKDINNTATSAIVTIRAAGECIISGLSSYIRRGSFSNADSAKTGLWTVYGKLSLSSTHTSRLNMAGITVESGGLLTINPTWTSNVLNAGVVRVKSGGRITSKSTTNFWYANVQLHIEDGAEYTSESSSTPFPVGTIADGLVHYALDAEADQFFATAVTSYNYLMLSGKGTKKLSASVQVLGGLILSGSCLFSTNGFQIQYADTASLTYNSAQQLQQVYADEWPASNGPGTICINNTHGVHLLISRSIYKKLILQSGVFDNTGASLTIAPNTEIIRASGSLSSAPQFNGAYALTYVNTNEAITTGPELAAGIALNSLTLSGSYPVTLSGNCTINNSLALAASSLVTNGFTCNFTMNAGTPLESNAAHINGIATTQGKTLNQLTAGFLGLSFPEAAEAVQVTLERVTSSPVQSAVNQSIAVIWKVQSAFSGSTKVQLQWLSCWDNGKAFTTQNPPEVWISSNNGINWNKSTTPVSVNDMHNVAFSINGNGWFTISDKQHPLSGEQFTLLVTAIPEGLWNGANVVRDTLFAVLRLSVPPYTIVTNSKQYFTQQGTGQMQFFDLQNNTPYYLVVSQRSTIDVWSAVPVSFSNNAASYDFTSSAQAAYGSNTHLRAGKYCMYSGDVNRDGFIDYNDLSIVLQHAGTYMQGYVTSDVNGDGIVDLGDVIIVENNMYHAVGTIVP